MTVFAVLKEVLFSIHGEKMKEEVQMGISAQLKFACHQQQLQLLKVT